MSHPDAFLNAILEQPDLDEPRLTYADWLDERCNPLGEFIRVQCRLAHSQTGESLWELEQREQELLAEFEGDWAGVPQSASLGSSGGHMKFFVFNHKIIVPATPGIFPVAIEKMYDPPGFGGSAGSGTQKTP